MPFLDDAVPAGLAPQIEQPLDITVPVPPFAKLFDAAAQQHNPWVSTATALTEPSMGAPAPDYDPFRNLTGYEDYAASFIEANNDLDVAHIKARIDRERRNNELLASGGVQGLVASIGAGLADPLLLVPVGGQLVAVGRTGRALESALRVGATTAALTAGQEAVLQATQITRPLSESVVNVAGATVLGSVLGGAAGALARPLTDELARSAIRAGEVFDRELGGVPPLRTGFVEGELPPVTGEGGAAGAAAVRGTTLDQETIAGTLGIERGLAFSSPTLRLSTSPSVVTRQLGHELADQPLATRGNVEGVASPISVERRIKMWDGPLAEALTDLDDAFVRYRLGRERRLGDIVRTAVRDVVSDRAGALSYNEFKEAVARAMRRGDASDIPEVTEAATALRTKLFDPLKDRAVAAGLMPADVEVTTALSYLTRLYDTARIAARRTEFEGILLRWLRGTKGVGDTLAELEVRDVARQITDQLLHAAPNRTTYAPIPLTRGPLRERTLDIPDERIEDFLVNDIVQVARAYARSMATDAEMTTAFGRADMATQLDQVREHYATLRAQAPEASHQRLDNRMQRDLRDLAAVNARLRGLYGLPDEPNGLWNRAYHVVRDLNYLRLLGGMTISAFPDMGRTVMVHGITRVIGDGLVPLLRGFREFRLSANEVKLAGNALDMVLDSRAMSLADVMDDYGRWSRFERGIQGLASRFGVVTLMAPWNAALKQFVGVIGQTRTLEAVERIAQGQTVRGVERTRLAQLGIDDEMARRIHAEFAAHGERGTSWWANTAAWTDTGAADAFRAALSKEVDIAIVTPGQERPLWMSRGIGRVVSQFRSFAMASTQRVMMTGLQRRDMATLNGVLMMTALGMMSWRIKRSLDPHGKELPELDSSGIAQWVREGVDQAGLIGWLFEVNNLAEKVTRGSVGVSRLTGAPPLSRYAATSVMGSLLGPTYRFGEDVAATAAGLSADQWTEGDSRAARRMVPYQNLWAARHLFDMAEDGLNGALGARR